MARPTNKGLVSKQNLVNIGNAIRTKTGETAPIALTDMPSKILALGTAENPLIATSDSEMATYLADADKSGMFVQFNGTSTTYVNGEVYRIMDSGDITQYVPQSGNVTKGLVFSEYDTYGYSHKAEFVGTWSSIPDYYCSSILNKNTFCKNVTNIIIPNSIVSIGVYAFRNCTSLTSIEIPNGVTSIGEYAFNICANLTTLTIPTNVSTIGKLALTIGTSSNKATITMKGLFPPTIQSDTFKASYLNKIYVPSASVTQYKNATNWANFADYIEADPNE